MIVTNNDSKLAVKHDDNEDKQEVNLEDKQEVNLENDEDKDDQEDEKSELYVSSCCVDC